MKKILFAFMAFALLSCDETPGNGNNDVNPTDFSSILQSKTWTISSYSDSFFNDYQEENKCYAWIAEETEGGCSTGNLCATKFTWKSYKADFTSTQMNSVFIYDQIALDSIDLNCNPIYISSTETMPITSNWLYSEPNNTLTINFGNIFNMVDASYLDQFANLAYEIKAHTLSKIVLEGKTKVDEYDITRTITLE